jgi:hypothetical protein
MNELPPTLPMPARPRAPLLRSCRSNYAVLSDYGTTSVWM